MKSAVNGIRSINPFDKKLASAIVNTVTEYSNTHAGKTSIYLPRVGITGVREMYEFMKATDEGREVSHETIIRSCDLILSNSHFNFDLYGLHTPIRHYQKDMTSERENDKTFVGITRFFTPVYVLDFEATEYCNTSSNVSILKDADTRLCTLKELDTVSQWHLKDYSFFHSMKMQESDDPSSPKLLEGQNKIHPKYFIELMDLIMHTMYNNYIDRICKVEKCNSSDIEFYKFGMVPDEAISSMNGINSEFFNQPFYSIQLPNNFKFSYKYFDGYECTLATGICDTSTSIKLLVFPFIKKMAILDMPYAKLFTKCEEKDLHVDLISSEYDTSLSEEAFNESLKSLLEIYVARCFHKHSHIIDDIRSKLMFRDESFNVYDVDCILYQIAFYNSPRVIIGNFLTNNIVKIKKAQGAKYFYYSNVYSPVRNIELNEIHSLGDISAISSLYVKDNVPEGMNTDNYVLSKKLYLAAMRDYRSAVKCDVINDILVKFHENVFPKYYNALQATFNDVILKDEPYGIELPPIFCFLKRMSTNSEIQLMFFIKYDQWGRTPQLYSHKADYASLSDTFTLKDLIPLSPHYRRNECAPYFEITISKDLNQIRDSILYAIPFREEGQFNITDRTMTAVGIGNSYHLYAFHKNGDKVYAGSKINAVDEICKNREDEFTLFKYIMLYLDRCFHSKEFLILMRDLYMESLKLNSYTDIAQLLQSAEEHKKEYLILKDISENQSKQMIDCPLDKYEDLAQSTLEASFFLQNFQNELVLSSIKL